MPQDQQPKPSIKKRPLPIPTPEDFFVFEVDGFAQLTPEQKLWPVISMHPSPPKPKLEEPPKE